MFITKSSTYGSKYADFEEVKYSINLIPLSNIYIQLGMV